MGYIEDLKLTKAGKLHNILERARGYTGQRTNLDGWAHIFETPPQIPTLVCEKLKRLTDLVEAVNSDLFTAEVAKEYFQEPLMNIQKIINDSSKNLQADWPTTISKITPELLATLKFCALLSNQKILNKNIPNEEIEEFVKKTAQLKEEIESSKITPDLKEKLVKLVNETLDALHEYLIFGGEAVINAFRKAIGDVTIHNKLIIDEPEKEMMAKLWQYLKGLNTLISMGRNGQVLIDMGSNILQIGK
jgi:hypothetical protein